MRRFSHLVLLGAAAVGLGACEGDEFTTMPEPEVANVRFLHVVPDLGPLDFRFVDIVENSSFYARPFRNAGTMDQLQYKNARPGARHLRIFLNGTSPEVASTVVKDTTVNLVEGQKYTFLLWGFSSGNAPAMRLTVIEDNPPDPGAGNVGLRVINAAAGLGALNVSAYPDGGTAPATPTWAGVAELAASAYITTPAGRVRYRAVPAGGGAALFADALALTGQAATVDLEALPGTTVAGSAVTGIIVPRSVAGSPAFNVTTPGVIFLWDRRPPRTTP